MLFPALLSWHVSWMKSWKADLGIVDSSRLHSRVFFCFIVEDSVRLDLVFLVHEYGPGRYANILISVHTWTWNDPTEILQDPANPTQTRDVGYCRDVSTPIYFIFLGLLKLGWEMSCRTFILEPLSYTNVVITWSHDVFVQWNFTKEKISLNDN